MAIDFNVKTNFDTTKPGTIRKAPKDSKYLVDISDPNILHDFASYNCLFTLSTLRQDELENTKIELLYPLGDSSPIQNFLIKIYKIFLFILSNTI